MMRFLILCRPLQFQLLIRKLFIEVYLLTYLFFLWSEKSTASWLFVSVTFFSLEFSCLFFWTHATRTQFIHITLNELISNVFELLSSLSIFLALTSIDSRTICMSHYFQIKEKYSISLSFEECSSSFFALIFFTSIYFLLRFNVTASNLSNKLLLSLTY